MDILIALEMSKLQINSPINENVERYFFLFLHSFSFQNGFCLESNYFLSLSFNVHYPVWFPSFPSPTNIKFLNWPILKFVGQNYFNRGWLCSVCNLDFGNFYMPHLSLQDSLLFLFLKYNIINLSRIIRDAMFLDFNLRPSLRRNWQSSSIISYLKIGRVKGQNAYNYKNTS